MPRASEIVLRVGILGVSALEWLRIRETAMRLARDLAAVAYVRGLRDCFPDTDAFREFVGPTWSEPPVRVQTVDLAARQKVDIPPLGGRMELVVTVHGEELTRVDALEAAREWSRESMVERIAEAALEPSRDKVPLYSLLRLVEPRGSSSQ